MQFFCITVYVQQTDILHKNDSSTFSREGMARRQKYDLFVDKSSMKSPTFVNFKVYFRERNPITGPFLRNYCDITSYALVFNIWSVSENFLLWSRVPLAYVTQQVSSHFNERMSSFTELCTFENRTL